MAVGVTDITVDVSETWAASVVSDEIVVVDDSDGVTWAVLISSAWAVSCGNSSSHRASNAVTKNDLSINLFISLHPLS